MAQPYYHVGLRSKTTKPVVLYRDPDYTQEIARLPEGSPVEVLLSDAEENGFLLRTPFGLTGWCALGGSHIGTAVRGLLSTGP